jgi:competence protein ComEC
VLSRGIAYAPLFPIAAATTAAIVADRYLDIPVRVWLIAAGVGLVVWLAAVRRKDLLGATGVWLFAGGLAGAYHHEWRNDFPIDDVGNLAAIEPRLVRVRGCLAEEPSLRRHPKADPLIGRPREDSSVAVLQVTQLEVRGIWSSASGLVRLQVEGSLHSLHVGDEVEVTGWLARPGGPMNPGEWDYASHLLDDRIRSELRVPHAPDNVVRLERGSWSIGRSLVAVRGWGQRGINESMAPGEGQIASALLLGDNAAMTAQEWDRYVRTGVIHVLAISGQHLVLLGAFLWLVLRVLGVPRRPAAIIVATTLLAYALMTGGRPSAVRAAIMACAVCAAILLRARALPANTFALSWLVVLIANPTDLFTAGFQLSFLCVALLIWGIPCWFPAHQLTPIQQVIEESRSIPERMVRGVIRAIGRAYLITVVLGIGTAPLVAYWQNLVSPAGLLIGPPAILLTTIALIAGFLLMFLWPLGAVALPLAWMAGKSIALCDLMVAAAEHVPGGVWYVGSVPIWWLIGFYTIVIYGLLAGVPERARVVPVLGKRWHFPTVLGTWCVIGLVAGLTGSTPDELRVTFLAVDHGGCCVIETPDGRVLMYDSGTTSGPEVTRRQIAPYLWSRGIRRIDEVFISHADLDHFNGLAALLDRFAVGQVTCTPTFADKPTPGVRATLDALERRRVPLRIAQIGDRFSAGDVDIEVLHPPANGPEGVENVRSLVLRIQHRGHTILLTGDLEGAGLDNVIARPTPAIDVLMTPHHGSGANRAEDLANWAQPRLVVSSRGRLDAGKAAVAYQNKGIPYWSTWPDGAITIRSHATGLTAETFATGRREVVKPGGHP